MIRLEGCGVRLRRTGLKASWSLSDRSWRSCWRLMLQLREHWALQDGFGELLEQAVFREDRLRRRVILEKPIDDVIIETHE